MSRLRDASGLAAARGAVRAGRGSPTMHGLRSGVPGPSAEREPVAETPERGAGRGGAGPGAGLPPPGAGPAPQPGTPPGSRAPNAPYVSLSLPWPGNPPGRVPRRLRRNNPVSGRNKMWPLTGSEPLGGSVSCWTAGVLGSSTGSSARGAAPSGCAPKFGKVFRATRASVAGRQVGDQQQVKATGESRLFS